MSRKDAETVSSNGRTGTAVGLWRTMRHSPKLLPALCLGGVAVAATPLLYLVVRLSEAGRDSIVAALTRDTLLPLISRSLLLTGTVTAACLLLGVASAWLVTRLRFPGRGWFAAVVALPLAVPSYVAAYAWRSAFPSFEGFWAAAVVLTLCSYPYVYLPVAAALRGIDPATEEAARSLGRGPWRTFFTLTLPGLRPAATSGALLVALYVLSDFGAVAILRYTTFTRAIFTSLDLGFDRTGALVLSSVLVGITTILVISEGFARGAARHARLGLGTARRLTRMTPKLLPRLGATGFAAVLTALALGVPAGSLTYWVTQGAERSIPWGEVWDSALGSLGVSAYGALLTVVLALPIGLYSARHRGVLPAAMERITWVSHALPGVVVGLSLVFFGINVAYPLYQTTTLLAFGYAALFLPLAVAAIRAAALRSPPLLEETARSLGKRPWSVFASVTLPLTAPGVAAAALLAFLTSMKELPVTLLLRPTDLDTLATELWTETTVSAYASAAPYAAALVVLAAIPTYVLSRRLSALDERATNEERA